MKRFKTTLALFMAGLPLFAGKSQAIPTDDELGSAPSDLDPVKLRPLNLPGENLYAAHRSHSSHGSHRSSSGGGGSYRAPTPAPPPSNPTPRQPLYGGQGSNQPVDPGRAEPVSPRPAYQAPSPLSVAEKKRLQVMRVQIALTSLGLYDGPVDGDLGDGTKEALKRFQIVKGIEANGLMNTDTLNALGVQAVQ